MNTEELKAYLKQAAEMERTVMTLGHLRDTQKLYRDAYRHLGNPKEYEHPYGFTNDPFSPKYVPCNMDSYPFLQTQQQAAANKVWSKVFNKAGTELRELTRKRAPDAQSIQSLTQPKEPEPVPFAQPYSNGTGANLIITGLFAGVVIFLLSVFGVSFGISLIIGIVVFIWLMQTLNKTNEEQAEKAAKYSAYQRAKEIYEGDLKKYNEQKENYNNACKTANAELLEEYTALMRERVNAISGSLSKNEAQLKEAQATLEQLYAMNILHPKYRNFIAVSMLLEYFETERCDSLTGANGAYNLYESELRQNLIILKLDEIMERIDKLQATMYNCCTALRTLNQQMDKVQQQLGSISVTMDQQLAIQQQTLQLSAATAMYSAATAANTEALKYITLVS